MKLTFFIILCLAAGVLVIVILWRIQAPSHAAAFKTTVEDVFALKKPDVVVVVGVVSEGEVRPGDVLYRCGKGQPMVLAEPNT